MAGIDKPFEELANRYAEGEKDDGTYPGSRHTRRGVASKEDRDTSDDGDPLSGEEPRMMSVRGEEREFFTIGTLARMLNREVQTLRIWERRGYLPEAAYRSPGKKKDRLYTRKQILGLLALAQEEGLMEPWKKKRIDQTRFPERARNLFMALKKRGQ